MNREPDPIDILQHGTGINLRQIDLLPKQVMQRIGPNHEQIQRWNDAQENDIPACDQMAETGIFQSKQEPGHRDNNDAYIFHFEPKYFD